MGMFGRGRAARGFTSEAAFFTSSGPVIVAGGTPLRVALTADGENARVALRQPDGSETVLVKDTLPRATKAYEDICSDLRRPLSAGRRSFAAGVVLGAVVTAAILGAVSASIVADTWRAGQVQDVQAAAATLPQGDHIQGLVPALEEFQRRLAARNGGAEVGIPASAVDPNVPSSFHGVVPSPDGLPSYQPPAEAAIPASPSAEGGSVTSIIPDVKPVNDQDNGHKALPAAPQASSPAQGEAKPLPQAEGGSAVTETAPEPKQVAAPAGTESSSSPVLEGPKEGARSGEPKSSAVGADAKNESSPAASDPVKDKKAAAAYSAEQARAAAKSLVASGMDQDQAMDVLSQLEALRNVDPAKITPEMLSKLPHEVAKMLKDNGLVSGDDAPDGVHYKIIRVPESVIDAHRGEDGISDIPERNTWASTGNYVSIPLPGGGDVKSPEDLETFHLQP